jgi:hypothetical protein
LPALSDIKFNTFKFETLVIQIVHPYHDVEQIIDCVYRGETQDGVPHGLGLLSYREDEDENLNFEGQVTVKRGLLNGPALF